MIRRIVKLMFYVKAPITAFTLFHPMKAAKLWFAYVLGSALFGSRRRAEMAGAGASRWDDAGATKRPAAASGADSATAAGTNGADHAGASVHDEAPDDAVPAGASVTEGNQPT